MLCIIINKCDMYYLIEDGFRIAGVLWKQSSILDQIQNVIITDLIVLVVEYQVLLLHIRSNE